MPRTKGLLFLHTRSYIERHLGEAGWTEVLARFDSAGATQLGSILAVGWYDTALLLRLYRSLGEVGGARDPRVFNHFGAWAAEYDLSTTNRLFLRMANPAYVLEKSSSYWGRFHDEGEWEVVRLSKTSADGSLRGFVADTVFCSTLTPYMRRMFELAGAKDVHALHPECRGEGSALCRWSFHWK